MARDVKGHWYAEFGTRRLRVVVSTRWRWRWLWRHGDDCLFRVCVLGVLLECLYLPKELA